MKGFVIEVVKDGEVRYVNPDKLFRGMNNETGEKILIIDLSEDPVGMEEGGAIFLASDLQEYGDSVQVKHIRDLP